MLLKSDIFKRKNIYAVRKMEHRGYKTYCQYNKIAYMLNRIYINILCVTPSIETKSALITGTPSMYMKE